MCICYQAEHQHRTAVLNHISDQHLIQHILTCPRTSVGLSSSYRARTTVAAGHSFCSKWPPVPRVHAAARRPPDAVAPPGSCAVLPPVSAAPPPTDSVTVMKLTHNSLGFQLSDSIVKWISFGPAMGSLGKTIKVFYATWTWLNTESR